MILMLVAIALAVLPLRGALALPVKAVAGVTPHCEQIETATHSPDHMSGMQDAAIGGSMHDCDPDCDGKCCKGTCNKCVHGSIAITTSIAVSPDAHHNSVAIAIPGGVPGRTVHPPFRPPIFLPS